MLYRDAFRDFLAREFDGRAEEYRDGSRSFAQLWAAAASAGVIAVRLPESVGGLGAGEVYGVAAYEMGWSRAYASVGSPLATDVVNGMIAKGPPELLAELAPCILAGAIQCNAMSEPDAGSYLDNVCTTARRDGDDWVINGSKCWVTMGDVAEIIHVLVRTDPALGRKGMSMLTVDAETPGITRRRAPMLGLPVTGLLDHHDQRFAEIVDLLPGSGATALDVARMLRWGSRRSRSFDALDALNRYLTISESSTHLDALVELGEVTAEHRGEVVVFRRAVARPSAGSGFVERVRSLPSAG